MQHAKLADSVPAVIYAAKSTQDRHASIPTQIEDAREMAEREGWTIVGEYSDEGFSAYSGNRGPGLEKAKQAAADAAREHGTTAMLIAQAHDRFARGAGDRPGAPQSLGELWHELRRLDVHLRTVEDDFELRDPQSVAAIGQRAHLDSLRKSRSVRKGMKRRAAERGLLAGGTRPYGYSWQGEKGDKRLVVVPGEADVIRRIFSDYVSGVAQNHIAKALNAEGIRTTTGKSWYQGTLAHLMRNPLYVGKVKHADEVHDGAHEAILDIDLWSRAQALLDTSAKARGNGGGRNPTGQHLLTKGLLRCGSCGEAMIPQTKPTRTPGKLYEKYVCYGRLRHGVDYCDQRPVSRVEIDTAMLDELNRKYLDLDAMREQIATRIAADVAVAHELADQAERTLRTLESNMARIEGDYTSGALPADLFARLWADLQSQHDAAQAEADRAREHEAKLTESAPLLDAEEYLLRYMAAMRAAIADGIGKAPNLDAVRRVLRTLFDEIVWHRKDSPPWYAANPWYREDMPTTATGMLSPITTLKTPEELRIALPALTDADGLPTASVSALAFGPIVVGGR